MLEWIMDISEPRKSKESFVQTSGGIGKDLLRDCKQGKGWSLEQGFQSRGLVASGEECSDCVMVK